MVVDTSGLVVEESTALVVVSGGRVLTEVVVVVAAATVVVAAPALFPVVAMRHSACRCADCSSRARYPGL